MPAKKVKKTDYPFGVYSTEATLDYQDEIDLEDFMDRADWDKMTDNQKEEKLRELIEEVCLSDINYTYNYLRANND